MDILGFITQISRDMAPSAPGFQAQPVYVALSVFAPLILGVLIGQALRLSERILGAEGSA